MSLPKYQVHDESSQVSHTTSAIHGVAFTSNQMSRLYASCFQIQLFTHCFLFKEVHSVLISNPFKKNKWQRKYDPFNRPFCFPPEWVLHVVLF